MSVIHHRGIVLSIAAVSLGNFSRLGGLAQLLTANPDSIPAQEIVLRERAAVHGRERTCHGRRVRSRAALHLGRAAEPALKDGVTRTTAHTTRNRCAATVVAEIALAVMFVFGLVPMLRRFWTL